jgi:hypothetical protein
MGLDMYLKRCKRTEHTVEQLEEIDNLASLEKAPQAVPFHPLYKYENMEWYSIFHEVGYWRKVNAIHNWFVKNTQDGVDECQTTELNPEQLTALLETCKRANAAQDAKELPPTSGFFFGSTEVDEYYWENIRQTIEILQRVFRETNWEKDRVFYRSSW